MFCPLPVSVSRSGIARNPCGQRKTIAPHVKFQARRLVRAGDEQKFSLAPILRRFALLARAFFENQRECCTDDGG